MFRDCGDRNLYIKCFVILSVIWPLIYVYAFVGFLAGCVAHSLLL